ncbi:MAG: hypothetical protein ABL925_07710, partial [Methylococcales bacterium]
VMQHHRDKQYQDYASALVLVVGGASKMVSSIFNEHRNLPENQSLHDLGISAELQASVFKQLASKFNPTCELAKALFL